MVGHHANSGIFIRSANRPNQLAEHLVDLLEGGDRGRTEWTVRVLLVIERGQVHQDEVRVLLTYQLDRVSRAR